MESVRRWIWPAVTAVVHFTEALPTLMDIANEFQPNDGKTLRAQIDRINASLDRIEPQVRKVLDDHKKCPWMKDSFE